MIRVIRQPSQPRRSELDGKVETEQLRPRFIPSLADNSIDELIEKLKHLGHSAVREPDGCYFATLGIAAYSERGEKLESIGVYGKDRFDSFLKVLNRIAEKRRLRAERRKSVGRLN